MTLQCTKVDISGVVPPARTNHASAFWDGKLFVHGGNGDSKYDNCLSDFWTLDTSAMTWSQPTTSGEEPGPRCHHTMDVVEGKLWVFGGWTGKRRCNFLHCLNLATWQWRDCTATMSAVDPHSSHASAVLDDHTILIVGRGETGTHAKYGCNIDYLDTRTLKWSTFPGSTISRAGHTVTFAPSICTRYAFVYGGRQRHETEHIVCKVKHPLPALFSSGFPEAMLKNGRRVEPPPGRSYHSAVDVNGVIVIYGGFIQGKSVRGLLDGVNELYLHNGQNQAWLVPQLKGEWPKRAGQIAARIGEASILLFGGEHAGRQFNDVHVITW
ncbi:rab9 effector protein with kelch motifs-like isoform X1 [Acanthaster planci]|uniref:Rab9 effector protein with kelch motifs-like isoform X1 n=2 Tax=Acanthaster planci TaxID=133434 RepID=A0A8B7ZUU2_ACAPL|nr:rab9 effector protein with kelch motifs-like isoform X1 [Acanthaster planci]